MNKFRTAGSTKLCPKFDRLEAKISLSDVTGIIRAYPPGPAPVYTGPGEIAPLTPTEVANIVVLSI